MEHAGAARHWAARLGLTLQSATNAGWPLASSRWSASACGSVGDARPPGAGTGDEAASAELRAVMECIERGAQFTAEPTAAVLTAPWTDLREDALHPSSLGLYHPAQYAAAGFECSPFDPLQPLQWLAATDLLDRRRCWVPLECIHPGAPLPRRPLLRETSSGCAAHVSAAGAVLTALCEVIERDGLMLFWHRQPPTATMGPEDVLDPALREDLAQVRALGHVVVVASLDHDLGVPCFLAMALQGTGFAYGLGCHPLAQRALQHATAELGQRLRWGADAERGTPLATAVARPLASAVDAHSHGLLYHHGPWNGVLREVLANTLATSGGAATQASLKGAEAAASDDVALLDVLLDHLNELGFRPFACDITPPEVAALGLHVARVLVPGLVPISFGFNRLRLGCARLVDDGAPGRLCNLLPHFVD